MTRLIPFRRKPKPPPAPQAVVVKRPTGGLTISTDKTDLWRAVAAKKVPPPDPNKPDSA